MKKLLLVIVTGIIVSSCQKSNDAADEPVIPAQIDSFAIPQSVPVKTQVTTYVELNSQSSNPLDVDVNGQRSVFDNNRFLSNELIGNKFTSVISVDNTLSWDTYFNYFRIVPLSEVRTYADMKLFPRTLAGTIQSHQTDYLFNLQNGGTLYFPAESLADFGTGGVEVGYIDPFTKGSFLQVPHLYSDANGKRSFINSISTLFINIWYEISPLSNVQLTLPIPAALQSNAPDSIEAFHFENKNWVPKGYAKKTGSTYTHRIDKRGLWTFGKSEKCVTTTVKMRTSSGLPVVNAIVRLVNSANMEVSAFRTDPQGNAICFLPPEAALKAEVLRYWNDVYQPAYTQTLDPVAYNKPTTITIPSTNPYVLAVKGTATTCAGLPVAVGEVILHTWTRGHLPVKNGQYGGAVITNYGGQACRLQLRDLTTNEHGGDSAVMLTTNAESTVNINTCVPSTYLFANITIDSISSYIAGDASNSNNPALNGYPSTNETMISISNQSSGLQFNTPGRSVGTAMGVTGLFVNGQPRTYDVNKPCSVTFTRYDPIAGGYIEGNVNLYYKENNVSKHLTATFRVKRVF